MMTFEQFAATRRQVTDLAPEIEVPQEFYEGQKAGYVYAHGLYIEIEPDGRVMLQLFRDGHIGPPEKLPEFERKLYEFAVREGYIGEGCALSYFDGLLNLAKVGEETREEMKCLADCPLNTEVGRACKRAIDAAALWIECQREALGTETHAETELVQSTAEMCLVYMLG